MKTLTLDLTMLEVTSFELQERDESNAASAAQRVTWDTCNVWCTLNC